MLIVVIRHHDWRRGTGKMKTSLRIDYESYRAGAKGVYVDDNTDDRRARLVVTKARRDVAKIIFWKSFHNEQNKWSEITQVSILDSCGLSEKERVLAKRRTNRAVYPRDREDALSDSRVRGRGISFVVSLEARAAEIT